MIQVEAILTKFESLLEPRVYKISLTTQEVSDEQVAELAKHKGQFGYLLFKETVINEEEIQKIPDFVPEFKDDKTPGKRLRSVLYVYWNEKTAKKVSFDTFYKNQMEKIITKVKEELD